MKVYIRKNSDNEFASINFFNAYIGFRDMGWEIFPFSREEAFKYLELENIVVGFIDDVHKALIKLNNTLPVPNDYPEELTQFLGRRIWKSNVNYIASHPEKWDIFIKPVNSSKKFTGRWVKSTKDLISCGDEFENTEIWCSEPVKFLAEWRCFIRYGKVIDVRKYSGNWQSSFNYEVIEAALDAYKSAPSAYAMDFGVTENGKTLLVEVNDGYSLGAYGLFSLDYAKFLSARWAEITGTKDCCDF